MTEEERAALRERQRQCEHVWERQPGYIPPATIVYYCHKCGDEYDKDVS